MKVSHSLTKNDTAALRALAQQRSPNVFVVFPTALNAPVLSFNLN